MICIETIQAYFDGKVFVLTRPVSVKKNQLAIITIIDNAVANTTKSKLLSFAGSLSEDTYVEFEEILKDTERVDENEW